MKRWPIILAAVAFAVFVAAACAPPAPPPQQCAPPSDPFAAWYDACTDTIRYDETVMAKVAADYGEVGVDWVTAHEEGHRTTAYRLRNDGVDIRALMPGPTVVVRREQAAQCLAEAQLGPAPWQWGPDRVALGYWDCPADYVALVGAA